MVSVSEFLYQNFGVLVAALCLAVSVSLFPIFNFFRLRTIEVSSKVVHEEKSESEIEEKQDFVEICDESENNGFGKTDVSMFLLDSETNGFGEKNVAEFPFDSEDNVFVEEKVYEYPLDSENEGFSGKEASEFSFTFKFPTFEEFSQSKRDFSTFVSLQDNSATASSIKYEEVLSGVNSGGVIEVAEESNFGIDEVNAVSEVWYLPDKDFNEDVVHEENFEILSGRTCTDGGTEEIGMAKDAVDGKIFEISRDRTCRDAVTEEISTARDVDLQRIDKIWLRCKKDQLPVETHQGLNKIFSTNEFLSGRDFGGELDEDVVSVSDDESDIAGELRELEEEEEFSPFLSGFLTEKDFDGEEKEPRVVESVEKNEVKSSSGTNGNVESVEENEVKSSSGTDGNVESVEKNEVKSSSGTDGNKLESLWEHQDLIEQLKMELRKVRATGLPTILEDCEESPKITEELKPWKMEELCPQQRGDSMGELHKFYRTYRERMRKFDILNFQKMYAIGFLQRKDPQQSITISKSTIPEITSLFSQSFSTSKARKNQIDPTAKFIKEMQSDLEVVYVGQMCLSWEILHWQYEKALEMWESDPRGIGRYNEVAGEIQQFQVLLQRFVEDEPFQGPRVQNYVKSRCSPPCNLLQVPLIREDISKNRRKVRSEGREYDISSDMLIESMEESIRIFWRFVRADKEKRLPSFQELEDPQLFREVQKHLEKKEKKLKDLMRGGNCILRKFRKCREDESDQVLCFFSQVDMKLVSRVLHMSKITIDQLMWCQNKLSNISFENGKILVQPAFLLFPC